MTSDGIYNYTYDAWNRLVKVTRLGPTSAPQAIATYAYDALGRRYRKIVTNSGDRNREAEYFHYDSQWRLLEVCVPDATQQSGDRTTRQFVWGTQYIDELVCMDVDTDGDGQCTDDEGGGVYGFERYRYFQDANWNVTAIWAEHAACVVERYEYDPYGTCRIFAGWDSTAGCETGNVIGQSRVPGGNPIRYAGYHWDDETGMYQVRHRMYSPRLGRWLQRDPQEYIDGPSLYSYATCNPQVRRDPYGLATTTAPAYTEAECCKCLAFVEGLFEADKCINAIVHVMRNRQKSKWPDFKGEEKGFCAQMRMPKRFEGGTTDLIKTCLDCPSKIKKNKKYLDAAEASCAAIDKKGTEDPTGGAQYWYAAGKTPAWLKNNPNCRRVLPECKNEIWKCDKPPRPEDVRP